MRTSACVIAAVAAFAAWGPASAQSETGGGVPSGRVISVNFAGAESGDLSGPIPDDTAETFGLVPVPGSAWVDCHGSTAGTDDGISGTQTITSAYGSEVTESFTAMLTYSAKNMFGLSTNSGILKTWLGDGNNGAQIEVTNIPFDNYAVIVYFATDNGSTFKPVTVNGTKYRGTTAGSEMVTDTDNTTTWGSPQATDITLGTNALRVTGLSGDLTITGEPSDGNGGARGCIAGFQIVEVMPTISVNFAGDASGDHSVPIPETSDSYGLFPVPGSEWENAFTKSGTILVSSAYGSSETFSSTISYASKNIWYNMGNDTLLKTYLDDGNNGASISMENVPFTEYAVIVYCAAGNGQPFLPVTVNGKTYTWSDTDNAMVEGSDNFGDSSVTTPTLGKNALCVTDLSGALTVQGRSGGENDARGGIAAIQIICTGEIKTSSDPVAETSVISLNFGSDRGSVRQEATEYGLIPVPGYTWTNISGASGSQTVTVASGKPLATEPTVAYYSAMTWNYGSATDPFLKGYLDDGQTSDGVGASVTVSGLPFWAYDVVVYAGLDSGDSFVLPVRINDKLYTWDDERGATVTTDDETAAYGGIQPTAQYGRNALRVRGVLDEDYSQSLSVQGLPRVNQSSQRGGIAAIQIVERKVLDQNTIGELATLAEDTPVYILPTAQIVGNLKLPPDAILDLSAYALHGSGLPITGTLTVNEGTQIRLPLGASWTIAEAIEGTLGKNAVIVGGSLATGVEVSGGTITADASYVWTGLGTNNSWTNPYNWVSHAVPDAEADVTIPLAAGAEATITLPADAIAKSVTITGPESGTATLALTSAEGATGSLTVSGQMLTTGNVTVTQSADITVNGKSTMVFPSGAPQTYPERGAFHVEGAQAVYNVVAGILSVPTEPEDSIWGTDPATTAGGFVVVCGGATLTVGGGNSEAVLSVYRCWMSYPSGGVSRNGTVRVCQNGVFETDNNSNFSSGLTLMTEGGTVRAKRQNASVTQMTGYAPTSPLTLSAPEGATLTFSASRAANTLLTGSADVLVEGPGTVSLVGAIAAETYTGEFSVQENGNLTLADNQRPKLSVASGASVTITPTVGEMADGRIVFDTSMETFPQGITIMVTGVTTDVAATVSGGKLTLSWQVEVPTLSTSGDWSADAWTVGTSTAQAAPASGSAILDGSGSEAGITVRFDTALTEKMTSIVVRGNVTLVTTETQAAIPVYVTLAEGATLSVGATSFDGAWTLPAGTTLRVTDAGFSFSGLTLNGLVLLTDSVTGTVSGTAQFLGGLTVEGDAVEIPASVLDGVVTLSGDGISITGDNIRFNNGLRLVNRGTGNKVGSVSGVNGSIAVEGGSLTVEAGSAPSAQFSGATVAKDATLALEGSGAGSRWNVTGEGALSVGTARPTLSGATLPGVLRVTATADEEAAGLIQFSHSGPAAESGFAVEVTPAGDKPWVTVVDTAANPLTIHNVPPPSGGVAYSDDAELALRQAAAAAGLTGDYSVQVRTGGQMVFAPSDNLVSGILKCFTGIEPVGDAEARTVTLAYDFGITDVRVSDGQVSVTVKVQGADGAAGFAEGVDFALLNGEDLLDDAVSSEIGGGMATLSVVLPEGDLRLTVRVSEPPSGGGGAE